MPMAELFAFELRLVERGTVLASACASERHYNPLGVVQGGFAGTVLDIALGLASISVLEGDANGVATTDLSVRYLRPILASTGALQVSATVLHAGRTIVVAEATLKDANGKSYALAQSTSLVTIAGNR
jgi:uncharacterized protein (TIGR00369 family)